MKKIMRTDVENFIGKKWCELSDEQREVLISLAYEADNDMIEKRWFNDGGIKKSEITIDFMTTPLSIAGYLIDKYENEEPALLIDDNAELYSSEFCLDDFYEEFPQYDDTLSSYCFKYTVKHITKYIKDVYYMTDIGVLIMKAHNEEEAKERFAELLHNDYYFLEALGITLNNIEVVEVDMNNIISLTYWARINGIESSSARKRALKGTIPAFKKSRNWLIEQSYQYTDNRVRSGKYKKHKSSCQKSH